MSATDDLLQSIQRKQKIYSTYREYRRNGLPMDREIEPFNFGSVDWTPLTTRRMSIIEPPVSGVIEVTTERDGLTCLIDVQREALHEWERGRGKLLYADEWREGAIDYPPFKTDPYTWRYFLPEHNGEEHQQAFLALGATPELAKEFTVTFAEEEMLLAGGWHWKIRCDAYLVTVYITKAGRKLAALTKPVEVGGYGCLWHENLLILGKCTTLALEEALALAKQKGEQ